jgi:16S rRNA (guanine(966)-N(2))-methyltransferase RsmD
MRIISGKHKGKYIKMPRGIRPTQDKVRKALFDILGDIKGLSFLELFAGSGAVGFEAISKGAKEVTFIEEDGRCTRKIKENILVLQPLSPRVIKLDVFKAIRKLSQEAQRFDIIFLDPPYYRNLAKKTLQTLSSYDILTPYGLIVAQHFKKEVLPDKLGVLNLFRQARYSDTILSFYRKYSERGLILKKGTDPKGERDNFCLGR